MPEHSLGAQFEVVQVHVELVVERDGRVFVKIGEFRVVDGDASFRQLPRLHLLNDRRSYPACTDDDEPRCDEGGERREEEDDERDLALIFVVGVVRCTLLWTWSIWASLQRDVAERLADVDETWTSGRLAARVRTELLGQGQEAGDAILPDADADAGLNCGNDVTGHGREADDDEHRHAALAHELSHAGIHDALPLESARVRGGRPDRTHC